MASRELQEKAAFFRRLESLLESDSDNDEFRNELELRRQSQYFFTAAGPPHRQQQQAREDKPQQGQQGQPGEAERRELRIDENSPAPLKRTASAPTPIPPSSHHKTIHGTPIVRSAASRLGILLTTTEASAEDALVPDSTKGPGVMPRRSATNPLPRGKSPSSSSSAKPPTKKRKRTSGATLPEPKQVLEGQSFYYIPNDDVHPTRKLRINKAQECGGKWVRDIRAANLVIVEKRLGWRDIEPVLSTADRRPLTVVTDEYLVDCFEYRQLCNPNQNRYRITGCPAEYGKPTASTSETVRTSSESLHSSPQLTAAPQRDLRQWDYLPPTGTPTNPEDEAESRGEANREIVPSSQPEETPRNAVADRVIPSSQNHRVDRPPSNLDGPALEKAPRAVELSRPDDQDELAQCIGMILQTRHLPLEGDDDDETASFSGGDAALSDPEEGSEEERGQKRRALDESTGSRRKNVGWEDRFACNRGGTKEEASNSTNPNARTIELLEEMCDHYSRIDEHWRTLSYRKAIATLRRQAARITTEKEAVALPNIGERIAKKIEEIVNTDRLLRLEYAQKEPSDQVLQVFLKIYGVGIAQANRWIAQGFETLEDLKARAKLTPNQRVGIDHYDDLNERIPRKEVEALGDYVQKAAAQIDSQVETLIGGSYRRGSDSSGDIDFIVTKKGTTTSGDLVPFLEELVSRLTSEGFLTATLASLHAHRSSKEGPGSKWHGCCVLPRIPGGPNDRDGYRPVWRRVDFLLVPETEYGAALIYFTGNDIFNRSIRLLASKKGMRLNQRGLYKDVMRGPGREKYTPGELVEGRDERRIFEILGVRWREPHERWC